MYIMYFLLWVIFNGRFNLEIAIFGVIISAVIFIFSCKFADYSIQKEKKLYKNIFRLIKYIFMLIGEVIKSNFKVMRLILTQKEEIEPVLATFDTKLEKPTEQSILANTITLTPGTITVSLEEKQYTVHCLDEEFVDGIDDNSFIDILQDIEEN
ncbi:MAG: Na+/H+ antiporter subunit E [Lachnospiraceae bacterium]|nr:Na+/H+ antiporter subunit E [Lachnospiraceae bacterium]